MNEKKKTGRPPKPIDLDGFERLCQLLCTLEEIAGWFGVSKETIVRRVSEHYDEPFPTIFEQKKQGGKISLRRSQFRLSEKNAAMAIFLGKNYLGQSDNPQGVDVRLTLPESFIIEEVSGVKEDEETKVLQ